MAEISEGDLRAKLRDGGKITGVIVIARPVDESIEYTPFLLLSWHRGYHRIARWRGGERRWREFDRAFRLLRELGWADAVPVYDVSDPKLLRVRAIARVMGVPPVLRRRREPMPEQPVDADTPGDVLDVPVVQDRNEDPRPK